MSSISDLPCHEACSLQLQNGIRERLDGHMGGSVVSVIPVLLEDTGANPARAPASFGNGSQGGVSTHTFFVQISQPCLQEVGPVAMNPILLTLDEVELGDPMIGAVTSSTDHSNSYPWMDSDFLDLVPSIMLSSMETDSQPIALEEFEPSHSFFDVLVEGTIAHQLSIEYVETQTNFPSIFNGTPGGSTGITAEASVTESRIIATPTLPTTTPRTSVRTPNILRSSRRSHATLTTISSTPIRAQPQLGLVTSSVSSSKTMTVEKKRKRTPSRKVTDSRTLNSRVMLHCSLCGKRYGSPNGLKYHLNTIHSTGPRQMLPCRICGKEFASRHGRLYHEKTHAKVTQDENEGPRVLPNNKENVLREVTNMLK